MAVLAGFENQKIDLGNRLAHLFDSLREIGFPVTPRQRADTVKVMLGFCDRGIHTIPAARVCGAIGPILSGSADELQSFKKLFNTHFDVENTAEPIHFFDGAVLPPDVQVDYEPASLIGTESDNKGEGEKPKYRNLIGVIILAIILAGLAIAIYAPLREQVQCYFDIGDCQTTGPTGTDKERNPKTKPESPTKITDRTGSPDFEIDKVDYTKDVIAAADATSRILEPDNELTLSDVSRRLYPADQNKNDPKRWVRFLRAATEHMAEVHDKTLNFSTGLSKSLEAFEKQILENDRRIAEVDKRQKEIVLFRSRAAKLTKTIRELEARVKIRRRLDKSKGIIGAINKLQKKVNPQSNQLSVLLAALDRERLKLKALLARFKRLKPIIDQNPQQITNSTNQFSALVATVLWFEGRTTLPVSVFQVDEILRAVGYQIKPQKGLKYTSGKKDLPSFLTGSDKFALFLVFIPLCVGYFWLGRRKDRTRAYLRRRMPSVPPLMRRVAVNGGSFSKLIQKQGREAGIQLGRREALPSNRIDPGKTVSATISNGGWLKPIYQNLLKRPEYLIIISSEGDDDQNAQRADKLVSILNNEDVAVARYFMSADANAFYSSPAGPFKTLFEMWLDYPDHRLIFMGKGSVFLRPGRHAPWPWTKALAFWSYKAFLTPVAPEAWGRRENALSQLFGATPQPLTLTGLTVAGQAMSELYTVSSDQVATDKVHTLYSWEQRPKRWLSPADLTEEHWGELLDDLKRYFIGEETDTLIWLCACAIYPAVRWDIALFLGLKLYDAEGRSYYSEKSAMKLADLIWFRAGYMPDPIRHRLLEYLKQNNPRAHRDAVLAVADLLKGENPDKNLRVDEAIILEIGQEPKSDIHAKAIMRRQARDVVLVDRLAAEEVTDLDVEVPESWAERLMLMSDGLLFKEFAGVAIFIAYAVALIIVAPWPIDGPLTSYPWTALLVLVVFIPLSWSLFKWLRRRREMRQ